MIELLVALVIFAVISALGYRSLSTLIQTKARVDAENMRWREVMHFFNRLDMDLHKHVNRTTRLERDIKPPWEGKAYLHGSDDAQLIFSRLGAPEQFGWLLDTQRIGYRFYAGNIERLVWPALDIERDQKPSVYKVLTGVKAMSIRYLQHKSRAWISHWPTQDKQEVIPKAVHIELTLKTGEKLNRIFYLQ